MPMFTMPSGLMLDQPVLSPNPYWRWGVNVRSRMGMVETLGLFGPLRNAAGTHLQLPGANPHRSIKAIPSPAQGQMIAGSVTHVAALQFDPGSIPGTGTRWLIHPITPAGLPPINDTVSDPGVGRIELPPVWWWAEQEDIVVGARSNDTAGGVYVWNRAVASPMTALANAPKGAVGGGIVGRILVLLGAEGIATTGSGRVMTVRWSDRFDFTQWTPSDINVSGELQLEGGSRIMGGGVVAQGIVAWTDTRMALLTETGDPDSVFARRYIDGARGLMANRSWCEADGRVWWFDETRTLNVWDGGAPQQIENPLRLGTVERMTDRAVARAFMVPNPEANEITLWIGLTDPDNPDTALVYNIADKAWTVWRLPRRGWAPRVGAIRSIGVDHANRLWQHDLDAGMGEAWLPVDIPPVAGGFNPLADVATYSWKLESNLIVTEEPEQLAQRMTRHLMDHLPCPAPGHGTDKFRVTVRGYGEPRIDAETFDDWQDIDMGQVQADFRVGGKAIQLIVEGTGATVWRFGASSSITAPEGER